MHCSPVTSPSSVSPTWVDSPSDGDDGLGDNVLDAGASGSAAPAAAAPEAAEAAVRVIYRRRTRKRKREREAQEPHPAGPIRATAPRPGPVPRRRVFSGLRMLRLRRVGPVLPTHEPQQLLDDLQPPCWWFVGDEDLPILEQPTKLTPRWRLIPLAFALCCLQARVCHALFDARFRRPPSFMVLRCGFLECVGLQLLQRPGEVAAVLTNGQKMALDVRTRALHVDPFAAACDCG